MLLGCMECRRLVISLVVLLVFMQTVVSHSNLHCLEGLDSPGATIPKGDIILKHGDPLEIFCNLNMSHKEAVGRNSSHLFFYRNGKRVPSEFIKIINASTIRLYESKPPPSSNIYYCNLALPHNMTGVCLNLVAIGFKPQEVKDFSCISHNWYNLTCRWIKPENPIKTNYKLHFYLPGRAGKRMLYSCPDDKKDEKSSSLKSNLQKNEEMCFWDLQTVPHYRQPYEYYYFEMKGNNALGEVKFEPIKFHHYSHVIPSPPEKLRVENTTKNSAFLTWNVPFPMRMFPPGVHHRMVYQSTYDSSNTWHVANTTYLNDHAANYTYNLTGLKYANTLYDVRVYLRSAFAVGDDKWSYHASVTFKTQPTEPGSPPETVIGSFEVTAEGTYRDVLIYWRQLPRSLYNGDDFDYKIISIKENGIERHLNYNHTHTYARFKGLTYNSYEFTVVSTNVIGYSATNSVIRVPSKQDMPKQPVSFTKIAFQDGIYELSWKAPSDSPNIDTYTIFWCLNGRDRPYQCTGFLNWTVVPANVTLKNITVSDESKIYQFAISANTKYASSGMVWASCTVIHNKVVDKMKSVWISHTGSTYIEVGWKLECSDRIGQVKGFEIGFCPILSPRETAACKEPNQTMNFEPSERQFHGNVTGLKPYTTYMVTVAILTNNGKGTPSDPLLSTTLEAAPDPPTNVRVSNITNTSAVVEWQTPSSINGVFRQYKIQINDTEKTIDSKNSTSYLMTGLLSYTYYIIKINACTFVCSESSNPVTIRTNIGNPGKVERPQPKFLNDSLILVSWAPPRRREFGGRLDYYIIRVQQFDGNTNTSLLYYNSTELESQIPVPECSKDQSHVKYTFWVRAVNMDERKKPYYGLWSDPGETTCYSSGPTRTVKVTIYVVCFLSIASLCIGVACAGKRIWKWCKDMQQVEVKLPAGLAPSGDKEKDQEFPIDVTWGSGEHDHHLTGKVRAPADEELLLKKKEKKEERHGRNPSGDSSGCSSGHESVSSSLTSGTQISSDSGTEVDQRVPTPDGVFEEQTPWDRASLRLRKASSSVVRSTPNLSDVEGMTSSHCIAGWSSTGYISMPSSEEVVPGTVEGISYCRVGLESYPSRSQISQLPQVQEASHDSQLPAAKGYVVLSNGRSSSGILSPQVQHSPLSQSPPLRITPQPAPHGYVSHHLSWTEPKDGSKKGYVMAGKLEDSACKINPLSFMVALDEDHGILDTESSEGDIQTPESYCRLGLCPTSEVLQDSEDTMKPNSGYVTLGEGSLSNDIVCSERDNRVSKAGGASGYVPHRHFEERNTLNIPPSCPEEIESCHSKEIPSCLDERK